MGTHKTGTIMRVVHALFRTRTSRLQRLLPLAPQRAVKINSLVAMIGQTEDHEWDCGQVFELLDQYAEIVEKGENPQVLLPQVYRHLERCTDCREELLALLEALKAQENSEMSSHQTR